jgi:hypothetical protein
MSNGNGVPKPRKGSVCNECRGALDADATGYQKPVYHTNRRWYHANCLEFVLWRKTTSVLKANKRKGKAGHAVNGRVIRSTRGLS